MVVDQEADLDRDQSGLVRLNSNHILQNAGDTEPLLHRQRRSLNSEVQVGYGTSSVENVEDGTQRL